MFNVDPVQAITSFRRQAQLDTAIVCFGHGQAPTENASTQLRATADLLPLIPELYEYSAGIEPPGGHLFADLVRTLITGPDGGASVAVKLHHALGDGLSALALLHALVEPGPPRRRRTPGRGLGPPGGGDCPSRPPGAGTAGRRGPPGGVGSGG